MNMVEMVARALCREERHSEDEWIHYCKAAKAALRVIYKRIIIDDGDRSCVERAGYPLSDD